MPITPCPIPCAPCAPPIGGQGGAAAHLGLNPLDPNNPFVNLSSEEPDRDIFIGINNQPPVVGQPPLGETWYAAGCLGFCFSNISQEDADICAAAQAVLCVAPLWPDGPGPGSLCPPGFHLVNQSGRFVCCSNNDPNNCQIAPPIPREVFYNDIQSCSFTCPDGSLFTFTVAAGFINAFNKATANAMAYAYACQKAVQNRLCPGSLTVNSGCLGTAFASSFSVASGHSPVTFIIVAGSLPPGIVEAQSPLTYLLSGTPSAAGDYTFTVEATDSIGGTVQKTFTISIYGIITSSELDDATLNTAYSLTLTPGPNLTGTLTYSIVGGSLPDGLTLNSSTGEISGTPTVDGAYQINVRVSNGTVSCNKVFDLFVQPESATCFDWTSLIWNPPVEVLISVSGVQNVATSVTVPDPSDGAVGSITTAVAVFSGVACDAVCRVTASGVTGQISYGIDVLFDGVTDILLQSDSIVADFTSDFPFTIPGPGTIQVFLNFSSQAAAGTSGGTFVIEFIPPP